MTENLSSLLKPVWNDGGEAFCEPVFFYEENGDVSAPLYYNADEIISLSSADGSEQYEQGRDYLLRDGAISLVKGGRIPFFTRDQLYPASDDGRCYRGRGDIPFVIFSEGTFFHKNQFSVTYRHSDTWRGDIPESGCARLPRTAGLIAAGRPVRLLVYGDSIPAGGNASGRTGSAPWQPAFGELVEEAIDSFTGSRAECVNTSRGGETSAWGLREAAELAAPHCPDLAIIAFGMNDGSGKRPPDEFAANIRGIMDAVRARQPECEFVLLSSISPNPEACLYGIQGEYPAVLRAMSGKGVFVADMHPVHCELLSRKRYIDMTGNNVNHPNDYLHRIYAQLILAGLGI